MSGAAAVVPAKKTYACDLCPFVSVYRSNWQTHSRKKHGIVTWTQKKPPESLTCHVCKKVFMMGAGRLRQRRKIPEAICCSKSCAMSLRHSKSMKKPEGMSDEQFFWEKKLSAAGLGLGKGDSKHTYYVNEFYEIPDLQRSCTLDYST